MTTIELISDIQQLRPDFTYRYILHQIELKRAQFLKNKLNQGMLINDVTKQTLEVKLDIVDQSEFSDFQSSDRVLRSVEPIPSLITEFNRHGVMSIRHPMIMAEEFNFIPYSRMAQAGNGRVNRRLVFCSIYNGYLYIKLKRENPRINLLTTVSLNGLFEYPTRVFKFNHPELEFGRDMWPLEFPVSADSWNYIKQLIVNEREPEQDYEDEEK